MKNQQTKTAPLQIEHRAFSATIVILTDKVRKDGNSPLVLSLLYERKRKKITLNLYWPLAFFDKRAQVLLPRYKKIINIFKRRHYFDSRINRLFYSQMYDGIQHYSIRSSHSINPNSYYIVCSLAT